MDMTREVSKTRQEDVDEEVTATASDAGNTGWWKEDCEDDEENDLAGSAGHVCGFRGSVEW